MRLSLTLIPIILSTLLLSSCAATHEDIIVVEENKDIIIDRARKPKLIRDVTVELPPQGSVIVIIDEKVFNKIIENVDDNVFKELLIQGSELRENSLIMSIKSYENISKNLLELLRYKREIESNIKFYERQVLDKQKENDMK